MSIPRKLEIKIQCGKFIETLTLQETDDQKFPVPYVGVTGHRDAVMAKWISNEIVEHLNDYFDMPDDWERG